MIQTIIRLVIGLVIVITIGVVAVFAYFNLRPTQIATKTQKPTPTQAQAKNTLPKPSVTSKPQAKAPTPTPIKSGPTQKPLNTVNPVPSNWKTFEDKSYKFQVKIPSNWETFKRAGDNSAYQIGVRPIGSADVPITISLQRNTQNQTLDQWVSDIYGASYPRTKGKIGGIDSIFVKNESQNFVTYYVMNGGNVYEFSSSVTNMEYYNVFEKIIASLTFK